MQITIEITNAQYIEHAVTNETVGITATIDGETMSVPLAPGNRHYDEIMKQVAAGDLTIADAD